jgi:O-antigen ligase
VSELARCGGALACVGLAALLVATRPRDRLAALGVASIGTCLLAAGLADGALEAGVGGAGALVVACGLAVVFRRLPWLFPMLALACVPVRVGALGHQLLVPLYVSILGAAVLLAWELARGDARSRELRLVAWPLAACVGWTGISLLWTNDVHTGGVELLAFVIPFSILVLAVARLPWSALWLRLLYTELALMALVFAAVGFYQYDTRNIFENPKLHTSNAFAVFFRVNSVFWDPSVYGRFLVVAMIPALVLIVRGRSLRLALAAFGFLVVTWLGLLISFSQSSFAALLAAVVGVAAVAWRWRSVLAIAAAAAVLAGLASSEPRLRHALVHHTSAGLNNATSGRASLVANGIRIAAAHPALGVGVGGFKRAYAERLDLRTKEPKVAASHDTPVTVAAETGLIGLALFAWLVASALVDGLRRIDRSFAGRVSLAAALALAAILVHSLFYADFFEDPTTWLLLGLVALAAPRAGPAQEPPSPVEKKQPVPA